MAVITGLVTDERYLLHDPGTWHPERPDRLKAIIKQLKFGGLWNELKIIAPWEEGVLPWVEQVHDPAYIKRFEQACQKKQSIFMVPDCGICEKSYEIALLAVGGVLAGAEAIMQGEVANAFCAVRPPGHHAEYNRAMGFCFFNNVAIAAVYLLKQHGLRRVAIVDWDVHHGNGTQHLFETDPRVFYLSLHEDPDYCYPGTGHRKEKGRGPGEGYTLNLPLPPRSGDEEYLQALEQEGLPRLYDFAPQFLLISAGFDAHRLDPLAHQNLTRRGYAAMGRMLLKLAQDTAQGRVMSVLEGGYNLEVLADCVVEHLRLLMSQEQKKAEAVAEA